MKSEIDDVCARLLDSEEHATDAAVPPVAEDAARMILSLADDALTLRGIKAAMRSAGKNANITVLLDGRLMRIQAIAPHSKDVPLEKKPTKSIKPFRDTKMAHIACIQILVNEDDKATVFDGINEILRDAQMGGPNGEGRGWIVDWKFDNVHEASPAVSKSVQNDSYSEGDAFIDYVVFSPEEARAGYGAGFWSNEHGWTTLDQATKYDDAEGNLPITADSDAVWMAAPYGLNFYSIELFEDKNDDDLGSIHFDCFAEDKAHAFEQAKNAYPNCVFTEEVESKKLSSANKKAKP
jgi:hypothetical protein